MSHDDPHDDGLYRPETWWPAIVILQATPSVQGAPIRGMTQGIIESLVRCFHDDVLLITAEIGNSDASVDDSVNPHREVVFVPDNDPIQAVSKLEATVRDRWRSYAYVFVDASALGDAFVDTLVDHLGKVSLPDELYRRLVQVMKGRDAEAQSVPETWRVLQTRILTGPEPEQGMGRLKVLRRMATNTVRRLVHAGREPPADTYPERELSPEQVRARLQFAQDDPGGTVTGGFDRWARAVCNRRVGLGLGGSGAWGYAHAALIDRLQRTADMVVDRETRVAFAASDEPGIEDVVVPVDLIASSSSGSIIGSYFAVLGIRGLQTCINTGPKLQRTVPKALITMVSFEGVIAEDLAWVALDELEVMFFPVATNLTTMEAEYMTRSAVPWAVRASCTFPGVFASTLAQGAVYCDGAIADNVPATLVDHLGGDLIIATNPLPPPDGLKVKPPRTPIGQFLREASPWHRMKELLSASILMFHTVGEFEAAHYLLYDPPPSTFSMVGTGEFAKSREIYMNVLQEREFISLVRRVKASWRLLAEPRKGLDR